MQDGVEQQIVARAAAGLGMQGDLKTPLQLAVLQHEFLEISGIAQQLLLHGIAVHFSLLLTHSITCSGLKGLMK